MLFSQTLGLLHDRVLDGSLSPGIFSPALKNQLPVVSLQVLIRTMHLQKPDGSWQGLCEVTAYAILTLSSLYRLPWCQRIFSDEIPSRIHLAQSFLFLNRSRWASGHYLWIEKTTYATDVLAEAYCLAAAFNSPSAPSQSEDPPCLPITFVLHDNVTQAMRRAKALLQRVPLFSGVNPRLLDAASFQACYEFAELQQRRLDIFPRTGMGEDKYLTFIPLTWMASNALQGGFMSLSILRDMIYLSMINYQVDEYMEVVVEKQFQGDVDIVKSIICDIFAELCMASAQSSRTGPREATLSLLDEQDNSSSLLLHDIGAVLRKYITYILLHPKVVVRPSRERQHLARELETFLLAHVAQAEDNLRFSKQEAAATILPLQYSNPRRTFYKWVRSTSADHTSCPFSWIFFNCLISAPNRSTYATARASYVAEDIARHLASLCRMYNDYGSSSRDRQEGNLNSVNFPEFDLGPQNMESVRDELMSIAEYERSGLNAAIFDLEGQLGKGHVVDAVKLFVNVTDLYGQIYVVKDIATQK